MSEYPKWHDVTPTWLIQNYPSHKSRYIKDDSRRRKGKHIPITEAEIEEILQNYKMGCSINNLQLSFSRSKNKIIKILESQGVEL